MSFSGIFLRSLNLFLFTQVFSVFSSTIKFNEYVADMGKNLTIPCSNEESTIWIKKEENSTQQFHSGGTLVLINVTKEDAGLYICIVSTSGKEAENIDDRHAEIYQNVEDTFIEALKVKLDVRTVPGPVSLVSVRPSTILGILMWDFQVINSGGYPLKSFTAEYRKCSDINSTQNQWDRLDPINIAPNVRYMEIYHLTPNTTYEFRIWGNNYLGSGEKVATTVTTLPEIGDAELLRMIMNDAGDFDTIAWFYAVGIVMTAMVLLAITVCVLLIKDYYENEDSDDEWETLNLIPNIILNPGFFEPEDPDNPSPPYTRTIIFGEDYLSSSDDESDEESIPFTRKLSLFFTGDTIKRL